MQVRRLHRPVEAKGTYGVTLGLSSHKHFAEWLWCAGFHGKSASGLMHVYVWVRMSIIISSRSICRRSRSSNNAPAALLQLLLPKHEQLLCRRRMLHACTTTSASNYTAAAGAVHPFLLNSSENIGWLKTRLEQRLYRPCVRVTGHPIRDRYTSSTHVIIGSSAASRCLLS